MFLDGPSGRRWILVGGGQACWLDSLPTDSADSAGGKLVAIDEDEIAVVEPHGRPPCRPDYVFVTNVDANPGRLTEILDHDPARLRDGSGVHTHRRVAENPSARSLMVAPTPIQWGSELIGTQPWACAAHNRRTNAEAQPDWRRAGVTVSR